MALHLVDLDDATRPYLLEEFHSDVAQNALYLSPRLSELGRSAYPGLLEEALRAGDDSNLAGALSGTGVLNEFEMSMSRAGRRYEKRVPVNAPETLAEGEFNRFYLRGLCRLALAGGIDHLVIYRAKAVAQARSASEAMIDTTIAAEPLLDDLRRSVGVDTALGLPPGPNSGLSARLP